MVTSISSIGLLGMEGYRIQVEVHVMEGPPAFTIIGLPDLAVRESRERVMSALITMGCDVSEKRVIVQLSPPEQKKAGPFFDVAIALGILKEEGKINVDFDENIAFVGSLRLEGTIQSIDGLLPSVLVASQLGFTQLYIPSSLELPLTNIPFIDIFPVQHLDDCVAHLQGQMFLPITGDETANLVEEKITRLSEYDFSNVLGQEGAKRAMMIAAAGGHHLFMSGPPGCGKTMLAERFSTILPLLSDQQYLEMVSVYQMTNSTPPPKGIPPFRSPHHSSSYVALVGGGSNPKPGEASLAHHGVLFLDELPEFTRKTLDMLREPLESGKVHISRAQGTVTYPARFQLISAMNPCPCGYHGARNHYCTCSPKEIQKYQNRISGPLLDRFDIFLTLVPASIHTNTSNGATSANLLEQVMKAQAMQQERYQSSERNATISFETLKKLGNISTTQIQLLEKCAQKQLWSNRVQVKILRLARTISDLNEERCVTEKALWEAMTYQQSPLTKKEAGFVV